MELLKQQRLPILLASAIALSACGGSGGGDAPAPPVTPTNSRPTANAGADKTVIENFTVNLDGSASSDPDGDSLTYVWVQTSGLSVGLSDANIAQPSFTSPDVAANATETLSFQLTVDDGTVSVSDTVNIQVQEGLAQVNISGIVSYEWVPTNHNRNTCF